jgi:apolipoprotein N-acyltransferase
MSQLASRHNIFLVSGYINGIANENRMLFMDNCGTVKSEYTKTNLTLFEDYNKGDGRIKTLDLNGICLGGMICHDDNYTTLSRTYGQKPASIVAVPTMDWATVKNAHFQNSIHRAIESRYGIVRATFNGISAIISPTGQVLAKKDHFTDGPGIVVADMPVYSCKTFYSLAGNWFVALCFAYLAAYITGKKLSSMNITDTDRENLIKEDHNG